MPASFRLGSMRRGTVKVALWSAVLLSTRRRRPVPFGVFHWKPLSTFEHGAVVILIFIWCHRVLRGLILIATTW